jgi:hypothetical protein
LLCWDLRRKEEGRAQSTSTARPEAKLTYWVLKIARTRTKSQHNNFYSALAVEALYPRVAIVPTIRTFFSLKRLVVADA